MFWIDNIGYDVPLTGLKNKADFLYKYAERTEDGDMKKELIGVYFNYDVTLGMTTRPSEYARLWDKVTEPVEWHTISLPLADGMFSFQGYFSNVASELKTAYKGHMYWDNLSFTVTGKVPARK